MPREFSLSIVLKPIAMDVLQKINANLAISAGTLFHDPTFVEFNVIAKRRW